MRKRMRPELLGAAALAGVTLVVAAATLPAQSGSAPRLAQEIRRVAREVDTTGSRYRAAGRYRQPQHL